MLCRENIKSFKIINHIRECMLSEKVSPYLNKVLFV